jgi:hypothetical protein
LVKGEVLGDVMPCRRGVIFALDRGERLARWIRIPFLASVT